MFFRSRNANFIGWSGHLQSFHFLVSIGFKLEHQTVRRQQEEAENAPVGLNRAPEPWAGSLAALLAVSAANLTH
ncbi:hypothetical protein SEEA0322_14900 [Salmonella enterica subsp. enterica serovar Agona str. 0322]|nr:hypothetical protein SEEA0322_14900 [Salmonella enterica subsp. enterica serovar Agona str. 0322]